MTSSFVSVIKTQWSHLFLYHYITLLCTLRKWTTYCAYLAINQSTTSINNRHSGDDDFCDVQ